MMRKGMLVASAATGMFLAGTAAASFTGLQAISTSITDPSNGVSYAVIDLYATFSGNTNTVLSVFNANIGISNGTGFHHKDNFTADEEPGAWSPSQVGSALNNRPYDSFVLIGGNPTGTNSTSLDPNFGTGTGPFIPALAGWFNSNPPNLQGRVAAREFIVNGEATTLLATWLGRFVSEGVTTSRNLVVDMQIGWNDGLGTPLGPTGNGVGTFAFVPAPGAIALLGVAGLLGSRRRRD